MCKECIADRYISAVWTWAKALANLETRPAEHAPPWIGFEMGVREAMTTMSLDLGWTKEEWDAFAAAAQQQAQKMIAEAE